MKKIKILLLSFLISFQIFGFLPAKIVMAQEASPDETTQSSPAPQESPSPGPDQSSPSPDVSPSPSVSPNPSPSPSPETSPSPDISAADINTQSPEPSPSPSPCDNSSADVAQCNAANIDNTTASGADTGNNQATGSANPASGAQIDTGAASSDVSHLNIANTNSTNSTINVQLNNITSDSAGDINLSPDPQAANSIPASVLNENSATVTNDVNAFSNTGNNNIDGSGQIKTGDAYTAVDIFNLINANLIDSILQFAVINIFGTLNGNIILPSLGETSTSGSTPKIGELSQTNYAQILNNVVASSDSGNNSAGAGNISTGDAYTTTNISNFANYNLFNSNYVFLLINNLGTWNGAFAGWTMLPVTMPDGSTSYIYTNIPSTCNCLPITNINQNNDVTLTNNVNAASSTGSNTLTGKGSITTGNSYTSVNLLNFVNANIVSSHLFFEIINIFGTLNGDIGDSAHLNSKNEPEAAGGPNTDSSKKQEGGKLQLSATSNVGDHVNPGDTAMFFLNVSNAGTGALYDTNVRFTLIDSEGDVALVKNYNLGEIDASHLAKISFGTLLSSSAPLGQYKVVVEAGATTGENNASQSASAGLTFNVGSLITKVSGTILGDVHAQDKTIVSSVKQNVSDKDSRNMNISRVAWIIFYALLLIAVIVYIARPKTFKELINEAKKAKQLIF